MFQGELYISHFQNFCLDSLCLSLIPMLLSHTLDIQQHQKTIPTHLGGGGSRSDPIFNFYSVAVIQGILLFVLPAV